MELQVNGERRTVDGPMSIAGFLAAHKLNAKMVMVEHNRVIVARDKYEQTILQHDDEIEIVQMMAGG